MSLVWNSSRGDLPSVVGGPSPLAFHRALPGYAVTPLVELPDLARDLGVQGVWVKNESSRLGLPAFKILGATWAVYRELRRRVGAQDEPVSGFDAIEDRLASVRPLRLVASTEGNHGRAVARVASWLGLEATILIPVEVDRQLLDRGRAGPTLVAVQCGVGSLAAAVVTHYRRHGLVSPPVLLSVEPQDAACVQASIRHGRRTVVSRPGRSVMAGLNCGEPSTLAWPVLRAGLDASLTIDDAEAARGVRELARGGISAGASGAAGLAGLLALRQGGPHGGVAQRLGIDRNARLLVLCTESAG